MSEINEQDKVLQAERKLSGLCQLCGEARPATYGLITDYCKMDAPGKAWSLIPNECLDKINIYKDRNG